MTRTLQDIKRQINQGETEQAIETLTRLIWNAETTAGSLTDEPYYLLGNAYRKMGNWQQALDNYLEAIERNPESPAVSARDMIMNILNFYNKDMYNQ